MANFNSNKNNEQQTGTNENNKKNTRASNPIISIIIAIYLIYISWKIVSGNVADGIGKNNWYFLVFAALFTVFAIWLIIRSIGQIKASKEKADRDYEEMLQQEREEEYRIAHNSYESEEAAKKAEAEIKTDTAQEIETEQEEYVEEYIEEEPESDEDDE